MVGLFKVTDSSLESWTFGADFVELVLKVNKLLSTGGMTYAGLNRKSCYSSKTFSKERTRLTAHYYLVYIHSGTFHHSHALGTPWGSLAYQFLSSPQKDVRVISTTDVHYQRNFRRGKTC